MAVAEVMALFSKRKGTDMEDFAPFGKKKRQEQLEISDVVVGDGVEHGIWSETCVIGYSSE